VEGQAAHAAASLWAQSLMDNVCCGAEGRVEKMVPRGWAGPEEVKAILEGIPGGDRSAKVVRAGALPALVSLLESSMADDTLSDLAAGALCCLGLPREHRPLLVDAKALPPLVRLLERRTDAHDWSSQVMTLVPSMFDLLVRSEDLIPALGRAGAARLFIKLLKSPIAPQAALLLWALAQMDDLRTGLVMAGAIPPLVEMLASTEHYWAENAATALANMCETEYAQGLIAEAGAIPHLARMLTSERASEAASSAQCLWFLAIREHNRALIAEAGAIPLLVNLLDTDPDSPSRGQAFAAAALGNMCGSQRFRDMISESGAIPKLLAQFDSTNHDRAEFSLVAIGNMAEGDRVLELLIEAGTIPALLKMVCSPSRDLSCNASRALYGFVTEPEHLALLAKEGAVPILIQVLRMTDWDEPAQLLELLHRESLVAPEYTDERAFQLERSLITGRRPGAVCLRTLRQVLPKFEAEYSKFASFDEWKAHTEKRQLVLQLLSWRRGFVQAQYADEPNASSSS
jgi:hypothetical protein